MCAVVVVRSVERCLVCVAEGREGWDRNVVENEGNEEGNEGRVVHKEEREVTGFCLSEGE